MLRHLIFNKEVTNVNLIFTTFTWVNLHSIQSVIDLNLKYTIFMKSYNKEPAIVVSKIIRGIKSL